MHAIPRPLVAAGVAVVGASAIALNPVAVAPPDIHAAAPAIQLTASTDWADIFTRAGVSAQALFDMWRQAPAPVLQQVLANQLAYLRELPDFAGIAAQIQSNVQAALAAPMAVDRSTLDATHRTFYDLLPAVLQLPGIPDLLQLNISPTGKQLLAFSTTALSGVILGMAGPVLGPLLVLASSLESIRDQDPASAAGALATLPAAMTDAFLNGGQHVDLTALAKTFGPVIGVSFPDGVQVGVALGGLLSPGGSIFNALDFAYDNNLLGVLHIHVPLATGTPVGPIGAFMEFTRTIAKAIGWTEPGSAAAARSVATQTYPAAANEIPSSVTDPTAAAARTRLVKVDASLGAAKPSSAGGSAAKRSSAQRDKSATADRTKSATSGKGSSARAKPSGKAAAA